MFRYSSSSQVLEKTQAGISVRAEIAPEEAYKFRVKAQERRLVAARAAAREAAGS